MKVFKGTMIIDKPRALVIKLYLDPNNYKEYQDGFNRSERVSGVTGENGCVTKLIYKYGSQDMVMTETIVSNKLPDSIDSFYHHKHMDNTMICSFEEIDDNHTRYSYEYQYTRMNWLMPRLIYMLFPGMYRKQGERWNIQFKHFVEAYND